MENTNQDSFLPLLMRFIKNKPMLVGLNPISTLGLNLRNELSEQNSEVTTGKEIIFYVDPPGVEFTKNYSSPSYRAAKILSRVGSTPGSTPGRPQVDPKPSTRFFLHILR